MVDDEAITLRPVKPEDESFLKTVFASTRADELTALNDPALIEMFVNMQFNAQKQSYQIAYPDAESSIILQGKLPIGRMIVSRTTEAIQLVDIALLAEFRARGTGSKLLRTLLEEGAAERKDVLLSVYKFNPAVRLYERLGFSKVGEDGLYIRMEWKYSNSQAQATSTRKEINYGVNDA